MLCSYGCGQEAIKQFKNGRWCCSENFRSCPKYRKNLSLTEKGHKKSPPRLLTIKSFCDHGCGQEAKYQFKNGKRCCSNNYQLCPKERKKKKQNKGMFQKGFIPWNKNLTKEIDVRVRRQAENTSLGRIGVEPWNKNKTEVYSEETLEKMKKSHEGKKWKSEDRKVKQIEIMKNGHAVHMNSFIINPSRPQVETWKITCKICPYVYLNYPVYRGKGKRSYSLDIAIPKLEIAIEVDGSWWHQDNEKDLKRQQEIEEEGWKFLRYVDKVPTKEQLEKDIKKLMGGLCIV